MTKKQRQKYMSNYYKTVRAPKLFLQKAARKKNGKKIKDMNDAELKAYHKIKRKESRQDPIRREQKNKKQREYYKNNKAKCNQYVYNWIKKQNKLKNK